MRPLLLKFALATGALLGAANVASATETHHVPAMTVKAEDGQGATLKIDDYDVSFPKDQPRAVFLSFHAADAERLGDLMRANLGHHLVVQIGESTTATPLVREVPSGRVLSLTMPDDASVAAIKAAINAP